MAVGLSTTNLAHAWLNTLRNTSFSVTTLFIQLHTGDPGASGTANVSQHTTRASLTLAAPSGGSSSASGTPSWTISGLTAPTTESITHISLWSASSAGTFYYSAALSASKSVTNGDTLNLTALTFALTPIAA